MKVLILTLRNHVCKSPISGLLLYVMSLADQFNIRHWFPTIFVNQSFVMCYQNHDFVPWFCGLMAYLSRMTIFLRTIYNRFASVSMNSYLPIILLQLILQIKILLKSSADDISYFPITVWLFIISPQVVGHLILRRSIKIYVSSSTYYLHDM